MRPDRHSPSGWLDRFFHSYYQHRPVNATFIGVHEHDGSLPDFSEAGAGDALSEMEGLLRERPAPPPGAAVSGLDLDVRLAVGFLRTQIRELDSGHGPRGNPTLYTGEAVFGLISLFLTDYAPLEERLQAARIRMEGVPLLLAQARNRVRRAPRGWTDRAMRECVGGIDFLTDGFPRILAASAVDDRPALAAAERAARSFSDLHAHLAYELGNRPPTPYAAGEDVLSLHLAESHFIADGADEIVAHARAELEEAEAHLARHAGDFGASTPGEALSGLGDVHPEADGYYARYQELWDAARELATEKDLLTWPDFPIRYVPIPEWARRAAPKLYFLHYRSPASFGRPPVHDYLVTPVDGAVSAGDRDAFLRANNDSVIKLNHVVHHGGIGHHVQNWHAIRAESGIGRIAAVDCSARIAMPCGGTMAEGWACYATDLMAEAGFLTPLEAYAEQRTRTRMCARAIVDVELHRGRMTLEESTRFYVERAGMGEASARGEAVKNSMLPGAALMYLMGRDAIHDLRRELSGLMGSRFSLRAFHDRFLSYGSIPVPLIAEEMRRSFPDGR